VPPANCKESTSKSNQLKYSISSSNRNILNAINNDPTVKTIHRVDFGKNKVSIAGERRKIIVEGDPGVEFSLAVNKIVDLQYVHCLPDNFYNSTWDNTGVKIKNCKIDSSGKFIYYYNLNKSKDNKKYYIGIFASHDASKSAFGSSSYFKYNGFKNPLSQWEGSSKDGYWFFNEYEQLTKGNLILRATTTANNYKINNRKIVMRDHDNDGGTANVQVYDKLFGASGTYKVVYDIQVTGHGTNIASTGKTVNLATDFTNYDTTGSQFAIRNFTLNTSITGDTGNDRARISFDIHVKSVSPKVCSFKINDFINIS
jgi:hypothetical protein